MMFDADSQSCDLLRRAMHAANEKDDGRGLPLEAELIAEIIFLRRLNRDSAALGRVMYEIAAGEREADDIVIRSAGAQLARISQDWELAPVVDAPGASAGTELHPGFQEFGEAA